MATKWTAVKFGDVTTLVQGLCFNAKNNHLMADTGIPLLRITDLISNTQTKFVDAERVPVRFVSNERDIIYSRTGQVGLVFKGKVGVVHNNCFRVVPHDGVEADYVYWYLRQPWVIAKARSLASGAAQPDLSHDAFKSIDFTFPEVGIQRRIVSIFASYDELIENSQRRIKTLESMARALYREALTAEGEYVALLPIVESPYWRFISENVSKYTGTKRYLATADIDGLEVTGPGIDYLFAEKPSRAQKAPIPNSVWFARMKETYKIAWYGRSDDERASGEVLSSGFAGFEARDAELWPLLFLILSSREFHVQKDLYCTGATQMSLTNEGLKRIVLPLPDEQSARRLGRSVGPMLSSIAVLQRKIENLRRTRDLLLPRLLSGQINVDTLAA
jgi:type I restriction enzyme S subunit